MNFNISNIIEKLHLKTLSSKSIIRLIPSANQPELIICGNNLSYSDQQVFYDFGIVSTSGKSKHSDGLQLFHLDSWTTQITSDSDQLNSQLLPIQLPKNSMKAYKLVLSFQTDQNPIGSDVNTLINVICRSKEADEQTIPIKVTAKTIHNSPYGLYNVTPKSNALNHSFGKCDLFTKTSINPFVFQMSNIGAQSLEMNIQGIPRWLNVYRDKKLIEIVNHDMQMTIHANKTSELRLSPVIQPEFIGTNTGIVKCVTNDTQSQYKSFDLNLDTEICVDGPYIEYTKPEPVVVYKTQMVPMTLSNWGNKAALLKITCQDDTIEKTIPPFTGSEPGSKSIQLTIKQTKNKPPAFVNVNILNGDQESIQIPLEVKYVSIQYKPKSIDFGKVDGNEKAKQKLIFVTNGLQSPSIRVTPLDTLKNDLEIKRSNSNYYEIVLKDQYQINMGNENYKGPGIQITEEQIGFSEIIDVSFRRIYPIFYLEFSEISLGKITAQQEYRYSFLIHNKGQSVLKVEIIRNEKINIVEPLSFLIKPQKTQTVFFELLFEDDFDESWELFENITFKTNEPVSNPNHILTIDAKICKPGGKACPNCHVVSAGLNDKYCRLCNTKLEDLPYVCEEDIMICPKCGNQYYSESSNDLYCEQHRFRKIKLQPYIT